MTDVTLKDHKKLEEKYFEAIGKAAANGRYRDSVLEQRDALTKQNEKLREALTVAIENLQEAGDLFEDKRNGEAWEYISCAITMGRFALKGDV